MAASVLFDDPGPKARARHAIYATVVVVLVVGVIGWMIYRLNESGQFQSRYFEKLFASNVMSALLDGLIATLTAAAIAIVTSVVVGLLLAVARLSDHRFLRWPATVFVEFFRAVPLLLMIFVAFIFYQVTIGLDTDAAALTGLVTGLTLYNGSVLAEVFRAGINAVPKGQGEAAYALGMRKNQVMRIVLIPQSVKFMLPAIISQCVVVLKDSSLGFIIAYPELLREGKNIATYVGSQVWTMLLLALIYITLNSLLGLLAIYLQKRASRAPGVTAEQLEAPQEALTAGPGDDL